MRLPRVRLTLWMLMILVALIAVGIAQMTRIRRGHFQQMAAHHALREVQARLPDGSHHNRSLFELLYARSQAEDSRRRAVELRAKQAEAQRALDARRAAGQTTTQQEWREPWYWGMQADEAEWTRREALARIAVYDREGRAAYHARMRRRFERAVERPWESVVVEPEPPETYQPGKPPIPSPPPD
jgi:hypothetical protein